MIVHHRKGNHFARFWDLLRVIWLVGMFGKRTIWIRFSSECATYSEPADYIGAYNKLLGRNFGLTLWARWGSRRVGWRRHASNGSIEIVDFVERDKKFTTEKIAEIQPGQWHIIWIDHWGIPAVPFFGGVYPAPHDMTIEVHRVRRMQEIPQP